MRKLLGSITILAIIASIGCFAAGWIKFSQTPQSAVMEIKTEKIKEATTKALEDGKQILEKATTPETSTVDPG